MAGVVVDSVTYVRSGAELLHDVSLAVPDGELLAVIGPSGSGKTTLLRVVAGLDRPTSGDVLFDGEVVTDVPASKRDLAMVFQDSALLPFRSARRNVSFPLEVHKVEPSEIDRRVDAESRAMAIDRFLERMPNQLAAGHQQLVQAARALVRRPSVFLLDEPLARVDPVLRHDMRAEIRLLQQGYGVTALYATNDPVEAMAISDRIAVLDEGRLRQVGTPDEIYHRPVDTFVAGFIGPISLLDGRIAGSEIAVAGGALPLPSPRDDRTVTIGVRPEDWDVVATAGMDGTVTAIENHGDHAFVTVDIAGDEILMRVGEEVPSTGDRLEVWTRRYLVFDRAGRRIDSIR